MDDQTLSAIRSADALEGLARVIRLSVTKIAEKSGDPDAEALARLAVDMVKQTRHLRDSLIHIAAQPQAEPLQLIEPEQDAAQVH